MNCSASYVVTYLCCYEASKEAASDKSDRFPVWSYFRLHQTEDKKTLCSKKKKRKKRTKTSGEKLICSGQVWKRLIVMDYDTQLQYVPTSVMRRDKIILPLSKILFKSFLFFREGERKERNSELPVCFSMILATSLVWTEGFFQDSCIWRVLIVDHIPAPLWSLSWWIICFAGAETCSGAPQRRIQCPEEDLRSVGFWCVQSGLLYRGPSLLVVPEDLALILSFLSQTTKKGIFYCKLWSVSYFVLKNRLALLHPVLIPAACAQLAVGGGVRPM